MSLKTGAGFIIICPKTSKMLITLRNEVPATWGIFGGMVESPETPIQCAKRELLEEAGFVEIIDYKIVLPDPIHIYNKKNFTYFCFLAHTNEEKSPILNLENTEYLWADINYLPVAIHFGLKSILSDVDTLNTLTKIYN